MLRLNQVTDNHIAVVQASGKLTREDYDEILPELEEEIDEPKKLNFYIELKNFEGMDLGAIKEDFKFDVQHKDEFGKIAVVGEKTWQEWVTQVSNLLVNAPMRFYEREQSNQAWQWLNK